MVRRGPVRNLTHFPFKTMIDKHIMERLRSSLRGVACAGVDLSDTGLQVRFGSYKWLIFSSWRLVKQDRIAAGSGSAESGKSTAQIVGLCLTDLIVANDLNDLELRFSDGSVLQSFGDSNDFEHWTLLTDQSPTLVAGPGSLWSSFEH